MRLFFVGALRLSEVHEWKSYLKKKNVAAHGYTDQQASCRAA